MVTPARFVPPLLAAGGLIAVIHFTAGAVQHRSAARAEAARRAAARDQVRRWADTLDGRTTPAGVYVRHEGDRLPEHDPWGTPLHVAYAQGGVAETLTVRSAGPDRELNTGDDVVAQRSVVNFKGVGTGVKDNVEEVARKGARGLTKGTVEGLKTGVREALAREPVEKQ